MKIKLANKKEYETINDGLISPSGNIYQRSKITLEFLTDSITEKEWNKLKADPSLFEKITLVFPNHEDVYEGYTEFLRSTEEKFYAVDPLTGEISEQQRYVIEMERLTAFEKESMEIRKLLAEMQSKGDEK